MPAKGSIFSWELNFMGSTFVIFLPPFSEKSAGIRAMWNLSDSIGRNGKQKINILYQQSTTDLFISLDGTEWIKCGESTIPDMVSVLYQPIIIHPELLDCNYFKSLKVARYYLNRMGVLGNMRQTSPLEYKIAFNNLYCDSPHFTLPQYLGKISLDLAKNLSISPRFLDLTYVGKGAMYFSSTPAIKDTVGFDRDWPKTNEEYIALLTGSRFIFSYDICTSVLLDAVLLGAVPIALTWEPFGEVDIRESNHNYFPWYDFSKFNRSDFDFNLFQIQRMKFIDFYSRTNDDFNDKVKQLCDDIELYFTIFDSYKGGATSRTGLPSVKKP